MNPYITVYSREYVLQRLENNKTNTYCIYSLLCPQYSWGFFTFIEWPDGLLELEM